MRGKHILVIEDEAHLAAGIKYNLDAEGYRVTTVGDGPTALGFIRDNPDSVDLVILDLMLPGMSGYAVCESLRADGQHIPILILSARTLSEDRARGFDVGADQYMTKPFDLDELLSRVKGLLTLHSRRAGQERRQPEAIHDFEFGENRVDFDAFQATVRGKVVRMTQLEIRLLRYFVENEGRIIPRRELLENVWEMPGYLNTRAPDQFIRRLRKIFEPDSAKPRFFLTIRDGGYRFVAEGEPSE
ncbi:MAG: response regulator transcription factor [Planctomycetaceae bacterium]|nr:response regulator transcription factor [Planctomycetaceae bacterium]